ncbi:MAG: triose-phosphate isomerase [Nitrospirota bacterium]|nr:triose-phosphate isomerase [Nitrospirota bacterium]
MRRSLIAGNWKMNKTIAEAVDLAREVSRAATTAAGREVVIAPTFTALASVSEAIRGSVVGVAGQDLFWEEKGAFTGEIAPLMLKDAGCSHVIIGHSERRQYFGETDDSVCRKVKAALAVGLTPIICVGELLSEREENRTFAVIERQIRGGLDSLAADQVEKLVIAYEPVWAIGTGKTATTVQAEEVHRFIRRLVAEVFGKAAAEKVRILYGGSVTPENIDDLMKEADIDGALVGGASLKPESFARIINFT